VINDGGAAFPRAASEFTRNGTLKDGNDAITEQDGMSLRDYFAAKAMQQLVSGPYAAQLGIEAVTKGAYAWADAMLKAREQA
jgi:hypothetical protein